MRWLKRLWAHEPTRGAEARERAEADLDQTLARWPEVCDVAQSLRDLRERNHFAEQFTYLIRGGK